MTYFRRLRLRFTWMTPAVVTIVQSITITLALIRQAYLPSVHWTSRVAIVRSIYIYIYVAHSAGLTVLQAPLKRPVSSGTRSTRRQRGAKTQGAQPCVRPCAMRSDETLL